MPKKKMQTRGKATGSSSAAEAGCPVEDEDFDDGPKLKGKVYPGMRAFDSATPEQKRLRNQRKDTTITSQLLAASLAVQPIEHVYGPGFPLEVLRTRNVYDPPSPPPGSPVSPHETVLAMAYSRKRMDTNRS